MSSGERALDAYPGIAVGDDWVPRSKHEDIVVGGWLKLKAGSTIPRCFWHSGGRRFTGGNAIAVCESLAARLESGPEDVGGACRWLYELDAPVRTEIELQARELLRWEMKPFRQTHHPIFFCDMFRNVACKRNRPGAGGVNWTRGDSAAQIPGEGR